MCQGFCRFRMRLIQAGFPCNRRRPRLVYPASKRYRFGCKTKKQPLSPNDPYFSLAPWQEAECFGPPNEWGGGLLEGKMPADVRGFDAAGKPIMALWPMRYTIVHWSALLKGVPRRLYPSLPLQSIAMVSHSPCLDHSPNPE